MAQKSRSAIATQITTDINDNIVGDITPAEMRAILQDAFDSAGSRTYVRIPVTSCIQPAVNYATRDSRNSIPVYDFDDTADETLYFIGKVPEGAALGSGLIVYVSWKATSAVTGNVRWSVALERMNTDEDSDSFDTAVAFTSTAPATSGVPIIASATITTIDGLTAGDQVRIKLTRVSSDTTNDTMVGDAELFGDIELRSAL